MMDSPGVRWAASQSTNPALRALMCEAERDRSSRPSSLVHEPTAWTHPLASRRTNPPASSAPPAHKPPRHTARPRSSSHATVPPRQKYVPQDEEPEAIAFIELLKDASKQVDHNSAVKQRVAARERTLNLSTRPLAKTSSVSTIPSTRSAYKPDRERALAKTASLGAPGAALVSGKSTPTSLPSPDLNCDPKPARASDATRATANPNFLEPTSDDGDSPMQDVIDLVETDTEWEKPISGPIAHADTTYMELDDQDSDTAMDMSFVALEPPPHVRVPKLQPNTTSRPPAPTQRTRTGPPPLGMRRAPQLQPSQYGTQGVKGATVPRFKPPLLVNAGGVTNKSGGSTKPNSRPASRGTKVAVAEIAVRGSEDADSSFDVSFDMDADALEEAMKAYD